MNASLEPEGSRGQVRKVARERGTRVEKKLTEPSGRMDPSPKEHGFPYGVLSNLFQRRSVPALELLGSLPSAMLNEAVSACCRIVLDGQGKLLLETLIFLLDF